jgi:hypothetical protein
MRSSRLMSVVALACAGVLVGAVSVGASSNNWNSGNGTASNWSSGNGSRWHGSHGQGSHDDTYDCTGANGGIVPPGSYDSMLISGVCYMPAGTIDISRDLTIAPGALLDATAPGDPAGNPLLPATVEVGGDVSVGTGAVLLLGCSPNIGCHAVTYDHIGGDLNANGALAVVVHSVAIDGNVSLLGGGGGVAGVPESGACFLPSNPAPAPWSEDAAVSQGPNASPVYSDFEDTTIGGDLSVIGLQSCWLGSVRDQVGGNVTFANNTMSDPDAMEVNKNVIGGNMTCWNNLPAVQFGDGGTPNVVGGYGAGECGFDVLALNPAAEAMKGPGVNTNIAVSARSLGTYWGTHTQIGASVPIALGTPNVTESGDTLAGELNTDTLTGTGLTGAITPVSGAAPGTSGETVLATVHPDSSESFLAIDNCACSFDGQSGMVTIRAYGTTSASGWTHGTFIVAGVAPIPPATTTGLASLAGYGTFWGSGGTLQLVEHLSITGTTTSSCEAGSPQMFDSQPRFDNDGHRSSDGGWWRTHRC